MEIAIFQNLPKGGGIRVVDEIEKELLHKKIRYDEYSISQYDNRKVKGVITVMPWRGFFLYNLWILIRLPAFHRRLANVIDSHHYDVVIVNHDYFTKSPYILRYLKTKTIYMCHEPQREFYESWQYHAPYLKDKIANIFRLPMKYIDVSNGSKADLVLANSIYSKKVIDKTYKKNSKVLYLGVDTKKFKPLDIRKEKIILCIGGVSRVKGHDFVISSIKELLGEYKLVIIGDGRKKDVEYLKSIAPHKNQFIEFVEKVTDEELVTYYNKAIVHCIGSHLEPFGLSSIESQACGTPVVAVSEGGYLENIIDGRTGYLSSRDINEFKKKTLLAIANNRELSKNCRENILTNWTWEKTINELDTILGL